MLCRRYVPVEAFNRDSVLHEVEGPDGDERGHHQLPHQQHHLAGAVDHHHPQDVAQQQRERVLGRGAEVGAVDGAHDVCVAVDEAHELLEAPEAALAAADDTARHRVVDTLGLALDVLERGARHPDDGDDERAERHRAQVVADRAAGARQHRQTGQVVFLVERPVPRGERAG